MKLKKILVMNGPNLDMLGAREPAVYGYDTLEALEETVVAYAAERGVKATCFQSNSEGKLINKLHKAPAKYDAVIYNPGAHTHYSYAPRLPRKRSDSVDLLMTTKNRMKMLLPLPSKVPSSPRACLRLASFQLSASRVFARCASNRASMTLSPATT